MQYHARALAVNNVQVDLLGHGGTLAGREVEEHPSIHVHRLPRPRVAGVAARPVSFLLMTAWRSVTETFRLTWTLLWVLPRPDLVLVQTPPAVPTLLVAWLAARVRGARFVIDWHNFGDRLLALRLGAGSRIARLAGWFERVLARRADAHLVVSAAMRDVLERGWRVAPVRVLYDRPATRFARLDENERATARRELLARVGVTASPDPAIVISPTSWTTDEDFDLLFDALVQFDRRAVARDLLVVLTGDGPRRRQYEERATSLELRHVTVRALWLESDAYPRLLAAADLGVCLHRSASGVDLPMKVADCFGAGVPVCALDYGPCLREMIEPGVNGLLFADASALAQQLGDLFAHPDAATRLEALRRGVASAPRETWEQGWERDARPVLLMAPL